MKVLLCIAGLFALSSAYATDGLKEADWVVETGTMLISGQAAGDLYMSLNADYTLDPMSTNYDQLRIKENYFARCSVNFDRIDTPDDIEWIMRDNAKCQITAPSGTVITE